MHERAAKTHPPLKPVPSLDGYDIVFVGAPIWYGTYAAPLMTFFDSNKLAGKTIVPFCTHGGGGAKNFFADVAKACPSAKVLDGLTIRGSNQVERRLGTGVTMHHTEDDVVKWLNAIFNERAPQRHSKIFLNIPPCARGGEVIYYPPFSDKGL